MNNRKIYFHLAKNSFRSIIKNYEFHNIVVYLPLSVMINVGRGFLFIFIRRSFTALLGAIQAIFWNIVFLFNTLYARKTVQFNRRFDDEFLFKKAFLDKSLFDIYQNYFT